MHIETEVKSTKAGLDKAKDQLDVRAGFMDAVAMMMEIPNDIGVHVKAIMRPACHVKDASKTSEKLATGGFGKFQDLILTTEYFRL